MIHQYKLNGYNIVLDVYSGSVHAVDEVAYDIIALYENTPAQEIVRTITEKYPEVTPEDVSECLDDVETLKEQGKCILLASHSATDIAQACDVVYAFHQGRLENAKACNSTTVMDRKIV